MPDSPPDDEQLIVRYACERFPELDLSEAIALARLHRSGLAYDVGPHCPRDELYYRLAACRVLQLLHLPELGPVRRYG